MANEENNPIFIIAVSKTIYIKNAKGIIIPYENATKEEQKLANEKKLPSFEKKSYRKEGIYDISQTNCPKKDYPKIYRLEEQSYAISKIDLDKTYENIKNQIENQNIIVQEKKLSNPESPFGIKGSANTKENIITINQDFGKTRKEKIHKISVLLHEYAHIQLHKNSYDPKISEIEAEASANFSMRKFGIITDKSSASYMTNYNKNLLDTLSTSSKNIQPSYAKILNNITQTGSKISTILAASIVEKDIPLKVNIHEEIVQEEKIRLDL